MTTATAGVCPSASSRPTAVTRWSPPATSSATTAPTTAPRPPHARRPVRPTSVSPPEQRYGQLLLLPSQKQSSTQKRFGLVPPEQPHIGWAAEHSFEFVHTGWQKPKLPQDPKQAQRNPSG